MMKLLLLNTFFIINTCFGTYEPLYEDLYGVRQSLEVAPLSAQAIAILNTSHNNSTYTQIHMSFEQEATPWYKKICNLFIQPKFEKFSLSEKQTVKLTKTYFKNLEKNTALVECILTWLDEETQSRFANFCFYYAATKNNSDILKVLLNKKFDAHTKHTFYLHTAVDTNSVDCATLLVEQGVKKDSKAYRYEDPKKKFVTPLQIAQKNNNPELIALLVRGDQREKPSLDLSV